jgi:hypothetical protein
MAAKVRERKTCPAEKQGSTGTRKVAERMESLTAAARSAPRAVSSAVVATIEVNRSIFRYRSE